MSAGTGSPARASMIRTCTDTAIPYIDGKVAAALCKGGAITSVVKEGSGVTDNWIRTHAMPRTAEVYPRQVATVLGKALLWKVFKVSVSDNRDSHSIPPLMYKRVISTLSNLDIRSNLADGDNP